MGDVLLILATSLSAVALGCSVVSLALHYARRNEHPDVTQLRTDVLDVLDKVEHWIKRDRVRRLRASREEDEPAEALPLASRKDQLRAKLRAMRGGQ